MKKLYNHTKATRIHPSPPPPPPPPSSSATHHHHHHHLSLLPITIATLATTLSPEDQEVLAYLLSISTTFSTGPKPNNRPTNKPIINDHLPEFKCNCFRCYTSFWARWDASPNKKVIHEIIDVYEDGLVVGNTKNGRNKKERRNNKNNIINDKSFCSSVGVHAPVSGESVTHAPPLDEGNNIDGGDEMKGSVRKVLNFVGERIWPWGVLGI